MSNQKGFAVIAIPLVLAAIGLISTGVVANIDHEKQQAIKRDEIRVTDTRIIKVKLADYFTANKEYPVVKKEDAKIADALKEYLGDLPNDPLAPKLNYIYWSGDGLAYTLTYFSEVKHRFEVVFSD